jgi:amino acid transporter
MTHAFAEDLGVTFHEDWERPSYVAPLLLNLGVSLAMAFLVDCEPESIDKLLVFTAGVVWIFFALLAASTIVLRRRRPSAEIPYKLPLYPFTPLVFILMCGYMLYGAWEYKPWETIYGIAALLMGIPVYLAGMGAWERMRKEAA